MIKVLLLYSFIIEILPLDKEFVINGGSIKSWARMEQELLKCILLCANCHAEQHNNYVLYL